MRTTLIVLALSFAACGGDDADPHATVNCKGWVDNLGNPITGTCEAACESPPMATGDTCDTTAGLNCAAFEFSGVSGCCIPNGGMIRFYECQ